jgi:hypothetical protein
VAKLKSNDLFAVELCKYRITIYGRSRLIFARFTRQHTPDRHDKKSTSERHQELLFPRCTGETDYFHGSAVAAFDAHATEWKNHRTRTRLSRNSGDYVDHLAFDAIVAMGKDHAVPLVMAEYSQDVGGW